MTESNKKKILILTLFFTVILIGVIAYLYLNKTPTTPDPTDPIATSSPFGQSGNIDPSNRPGGQTGTSSIIGSNGDPSETDPVRVRLRQLTKVPTAGAIALSAVTGNTIVRYAERATGDIYELDMSDTKAERLAKKTIPGVYEAIWGKDGKNVIFRYVRDFGDVNQIKTYSIPLDTTDNPAAEGVFFLDDINEIAVSPDKEKLLYLHAQDAHAFGLTSNFNDPDPTQVLYSPLQQWILQWVSDDIIAMTTKPSFNLPGYMFFYNISTLSFENVLKNKPGLTTLTNSDRSKVVYNTSDNESFRMYIYEPSTRAEKKVTFATLPEKCTWSENNTYILYCAVPETYPARNFPDTWYQGITHLKDKIWVLNTQTDKAGILLDISTEAGYGIDAIKPFLDPTEKYLYFTNKDDYTLWSLELDFESSN